MNAIRILLAACSICAALPAAASVGSGTPPAERRATVAAGEHFDQRTESMRGRAERQKFAERFSARQGANLKALEAGLNLTKRQKAAWKRFEKAVPKVPGHKPEHAKVADRLATAETRIADHQARIGASGRELARFESARRSLWHVLDAGQRATFERLSDRAPHFGTAPR